MSRKKREYEDDDGRTIADMTGISGPSLFMPRSSEQQGENREKGERKKTARPWEQSGYSLKERFWIVMGVMKATMLIALAYILGIGLLILLICLAI